MFYCIFVVVTLLCCGCECSQSASAESTDALTAAAAPLYSSPVARQDGLDWNISYVGLGTVGSFRKINEDEVENIYVSDRR